MLAEEVRSGLVETVHDGAVAVVSASGELIASYGDIDRPFYLRSSAKPFQAAVSQACGAGLGREQLALACASHDGEPVHVALVESILAGAGLTADDLGNPPGWPLSGSAERRLVAARCTPGPTASGTTVPANTRRCWPRPLLPAGTPRATWIPLTRSKPGSPNSSGTSAGPVDPIGVDGCGAPVFATTARGMGRAFARLSVGSASFSKSSMPCTPFLRWFRVSATSMPPSPPISMPSPSEERPASLASGCADVGVGGQGLGRLGSGRRGGRGGGPGPVGSVDALRSAERLAKALASAGQGRWGAGGKIRATLGVAMAMTYLDRFPEEGFELSPAGPRAWGRSRCPGFLRGLAGGDPTRGPDAAHVERKGSLPADGIGGRDSIPGGQRPHRLSQPAGHRHRRSGGDPRHDDRSKRCRWTSILFPARPPPPWPRA